MPATESDRLEMHLKLRAVLGDKVADTVMEHLPPSGWSDVARQSEMVARFETMEARFEGIDKRFDSLESRLNGVIAGMWAMGSIVTATIVAMFAIIVTRL